MHRRSRSIPIIIQCVWFVGWCSRVMSTAISVSVSVSAAISTATTSPVPRTGSTTWSRAWSITSKVLAWPISISVTISILVVGSGSSVGTDWGWSRATTTSSTSILWRWIIPWWPTATMILCSGGWWRWTSRAAAFSLAAVVCHAVTCAIHGGRRWSGWRFCIRPATAFVPLWIHHAALAGVPMNGTDEHTYKDRNFLPWVHGSFRIPVSSFDLGFFLSVRIRERQADLERENIT